MRLLLTCLLLVFLVNANAQHKYTNHTEAGFMVGSLGGLPFTFQTFNGIKVKNTSFDAGVTLGLDSYQQIVLVPLAIGFRYNFNSSKPTALYFGSEAGYGFDWLEKDTKTFKNSGGWMINPAFGIKFGKRKNAKTSLSIGYKYQEASTSEIFDFNSSFAKNRYQFNRVTFRIGVSY